MTRSAPLVTCFAMTCRFSHVALTQLCARARFRTPEQLGHPSHPHRMALGFLGLRLGATGRKLAIPKNPYADSKLVLARTFLLRHLSSAKRRKQKRIIRSRVFARSDCLREGQYHGPKKGHPKVKPIRAQALHSNSACAERNNPKQKFTASKSIRTSQIVAHPCRDHHHPGVFPKMKRQVAAEIVRSHPKGAGRWMVNLRQNHLSGS